VVNERDSLRRQAREAAWRNSVRKAAEEAIRKGPPADLDLTPADYTWLLSNGMQP
jgi:hypothetical protein